MPISSGLQKYFDSQQKKKTSGDIKKRFAELEGKVDPAFMQSFENFHSQIMGIIDENPQDVDLVLEEVDDLIDNVEHSNRVHSLKKAKSMIETLD